MVTRAVLQTKNRKNNLSIYGIQVSVKSTYNVLKLLTDDLKHLQNSRISIIVQNHQIIILISSIDSKNLADFSTPDKISINPKITKIHGVRILTGYNIHSLLHEDFIGIHKNSTISFNKLDQKTLWKPFKIRMLQVDSHTFSKMLDALSSHRLVFSFNPQKGISDLQITLIIIGPSIEQLVINTEEVRNKLNTIKMLHGELETYKKKELRKSLLKILLGINNLNIPSSPIIKYFDKLKFPNKNQVISPKYSIPLQDSFAYKKQKKQNNIPSNHKDITPITCKSKDQNYLLPQLDCEGWIETQDIKHKQFTVYTHSNFLVHVIILKNIIFEEILNSILLSGLIVVFRSNQNELIYVKSIVKD